MMNCPNCNKSFQYAGWKDGKFVEEKEPWECGNCKKLIETDKEKGYGLIVLKQQNK